MLCKKTVHDKRETDFVIGRVGQRGEHASETCRSNCYQAGREVCLQQAAKTL